MGTNYYFYETNTDEGLHIGKSSAGWTFSLRLHHELGITSLHEWRYRWFPHGIIRNEYDEVLTPKEMLHIIMDRSLHAETDRPVDLEFLRKNQAVRGPHGLLRHRVDNNFCIGHGPGTWDYMARDFS
jgi:hypothetical protein